MHCKLSEWWIAPSVLRTSSETEDKQVPRRTRLGIPAPQHSKHVSTWEAAEFENDLCSSTLDWHREAKPDSATLEKRMMR